MSEQATTSSQPVNTSPYEQDQLERAVTAYFSRLFRWLTPLLVAAAAIIVIALSTPGIDQGRQASANGRGEGPAAGDITGTDSAAIGAAGDGPSAAAARSPGVSRTRAASSASTKGVAVSGVTCGGGVRQVTWSRYAPPCVAAFTGDNHGSTSYGVTKDKITIVIGFGSSSENKAIQSLAGNATPDDQAWADTIQRYVQFFNTQFETYGRKVEIKTYQMRSDYILADTGRDTATAQADAQTAKDMGAFADLTALTNTSSLPYSDALAKLGVIAWGFPLRTEANYRENAPYLYNFLPDGTKWAKWAANFVCQRMNGLPATYAGGSEANKPRKFGLIEVTIPTWLQAGELTKQYLKEQCGVDPYTLKYDFDLGKFSQYGSSMMAQMQSQGVTTILCPCDPLGPIFMTQSATQDAYFPEWLFHNQGIVDQNYDAAQLAHSFSNGPALPKATEALGTYQLAYAGQAPPSRAYFTWIYGILLQFYSAVQMAGPNLTPATFSQAMASLPRSIDGGDYGPWFGVADGPYSGRFTPWTGLQVTWWDATAPAPDGSKGYWFPCAGNMYYSLTDLAQWGPAGKDLPCFGR